MTTKHWADELSNNCPLNVDMVSSSWPNIWIIAKVQRRLTKYSGLWWKTIAVFAFCMRPRSDREYHTWPDQINTLSNILLHILHILSFEVLTSIGSFVNSNTWVKKERLYLWPYYYSLGTKEIESNFYWNYYFLASFWWKWLNWQAFASIVYIKIKADASEQLYSFFCIKTSLFWLFFTNIPRLCQSSYRY